MTVSAILLAAGESTRMGELKALLDWRGRPLIAHQIEELLAGGVAEVLVVLGYQQERLERLLPSHPAVRVVVNPEYRTGRSSSIRAGLAALDPDATDILIVGVDQPTDREVIRRLIERHHAGRAVLSIPTWQGKRGHPPLFGRTLLPELWQVSEASEGLKRVVRAHEAEINRVAIDSPLVAVNLNRPEDYEAASRNLAARD